MCEAFGIFNTHGLELKFYPILTQGTKAKVPFLGDIARSNGLCLVVSCIRKGLLQMGLPTTQSSFPSTPALSPSCPFPPPIHSGFGTKLDPYGQNFKILYIDEAMFLSSPDGIDMSGKHL